MHFPHIGRPVFISRDAKLEAHDKRGTGVRSNEFASHSGTVTAVDVAARRLIVDGRAVAYDVVVLATGATHGYFGREEWAAYAPG